MTIGIVGGGIYGAATAYFLAAGGAEDVHVFEKDALGGYATSKSAGIVRHHYNHAGHVRFAIRGRELLASLPERFGVDVGYHRNGYLAWVGSGNEGQFRENVARQRDVGLDVTLLEPAELTAYVPALDPEDVAVAAYEPDGAVADPYLVSTAFASAARELGATFHTDTPVEDVRVADGTVTAVSTPAGEFAVDVLVDAAGAWADEVAAMVGYDLPLSRWEAKEIVLEADSPYDVDTPTISDIDAGLYAKPEPGGHFVAGGVGATGDRPDLDDVTEVGGVTSDDLLELSDWLERRVPGYADASVRDTWSGVITCPPDSHQVVGTPSGYTNFVLAAGGSGHGFKEAPAFAESLAAQLLGNEPPLDLAPYHPDRFDGGDTAFTRTYADASRG